MDNSLRLGQVQTWTTLPDKATWGDGPWLTEPDKAQWVDDATGLQCLALRHPNHGHWCGYVGIPRSHPWHGRDYREVSSVVEVHDRLSYSDTCDDDPAVPIEQRVCHIPSPDEPDDVWWFGFAAAGAFDRSPRREFGSTMDRSRLPDWAQLHYRDLDFMKQECAKLAQQLAVIEL